jgi:transketolase
VLNTIFDKIPNLIGGSADLTPSNNTKAANSEVFTSKNPKGRYLHYGVREHGMAAIMNGISLYSGLIPYGGTFLVFSDYLRPALRMAALMGIQNIFIFTHDSIGLGEDGPTHQPVEHINSLSLIPNVVNFRPMDAYETVIGWKIALGRTDGPTNLILSRQNLPIYKRGNSGLTSALKAEKGAYVIDEDDQFEAVIIASGSEVEIALEAKKALNKKGKKVRVVSMPSKELFDNQPAKYRYSVLPPDCSARVAIEAGNTALWGKYVGLKGMAIGVDKFGASAPLKTLYQNYGVTVENVVGTVLKLLKNKG